MAIQIKTRNSVVPPTRPLKESHKNPHEAKTHISSKFTEEIERSLETLKVMVRSATKNAKEQAADSPKDLQRTIEFIDCLIEKTRGSTSYEAQLRKASRTPSLDRLTRREKDVLGLIASGLANKNIARKLNISIRTVEVHRSNLTKKLGLKTTAALVKYALSNGLAS